MLVFVRIAQKSLVSLGNFKGPLRQNHGEVLEKIWGGEIKIRLLQSKSQTPFCDPCPFRDVAISSALLSSLA
jgi:hypothetical protein